MVEHSSEERHVETGRAILERTRPRTNNNTGYSENWNDEDLFSTIYLQQRTTAVPEAILSEHREKPSRFWWPEKAEMAKDLDRWYATAAARLLVDRQRHHTSHGAPRT